MPMSVTNIVKACDFIMKTPVLAKTLVPVANAFRELSGYRKMGMKMEDLISEENDVMEKAILRMPKDEYYARTYRILTAHQLALSHHLLPKAKQLSEAEDTLVLTPYILEAEAEAAEKAELDNLVVVK